MGRRRPVRDVLRDELATSRMHIAIVSDTHLPRGRRRIPDACVERMRAADLILHAGDICAPSVLEELEALGPPVRAVHGNADCEELRRRLPEERDGFQIFNPGSPSDRRRQPRHTMGMATADRGAVRFEVVALD